MDLLITGDVFISDEFAGRDLLDASVIDLFAAADCRIVNLEAPLTVEEAGRRILKTGPHLRANRETVLPFLQKLKVDAVTLANNHIKDYGGPGLSDTLAGLRAAKIDHVGAGGNLQEAGRPLILERAGLRLVVLNFVENEWASAAPDRPGAAPLDWADNVRRIREAKEVSDFVIVIIHGGYEDIHFPNPRMVSQYKFYAENGASAIVGHHPHCLGGYQVHGGTPIFYSLGNFIFTLPSPLESWYTGLILKLGIRAGEEISWDLIPVVQSKNDLSVTLARGERKEAIGREVAEYSRIIADGALLGRKWEEFLSEWRGYYLAVYSPLNIIPSRRIKRGLAKLGLDRLFMRKEHYAEMLNHIRCESHAEASKGVIENYLRRQ